MEQLIQAMCAALDGAGLRATPAGKAAPMPRIQAPGIAVGLEQAEGNQSGLFQYLGLAEDPEQGTVERYGSRLSAVLRLDVCSPRTGGAAQAEKTADAVSDVLLGGIPGLQIHSFSIDAPVYHKQADLFITVIHVQVGAWLYATRRDGEDRFQHFILKGAIS